MKPVLGISKDVEWCGSCVQKQTEAVPDDVNSQLKKVYVFAKTFQYFFSSLGVNLSPTVSKGARPERQLLTMCSKMVLYEVSVSSSTEEHYVGVTGMTGCISHTFHLLGLAADIRFPTKLTNHNDPSMHTNILFPIAPKDQ